MLIFCLQGQRLAIFPIYCCRRPIYFCRWPISAISCCRSSILPIYILLQEAHLGHLLLQEAHLAHLLLQKAHLAHLLLQEAHLLQKAHLLLQEVAHLTHLLWYSKRKR